MQLHTPDLRGKRTRFDAMFVGSRHDAAAFSLQIPKSCTAVELDVLYTLILESYIKFVRKHYHSRFLFPRHSARPKSVTASENEWGNRVFRICRGLSKEAKALILVFLCSHLSFHFITQFSHIFRLLAVASRHCSLFSPRFFLFHIWFAIFFCHFFNFFRRAAAASPHFSIF